MLIHFQAGSAKANYAKVLRQLSSLNSVLGAPWVQFELLANLAAGLGSELSGNWRVKDESEDAIKLAQVFERETYRQRLRWCSHHMPRFG